MLKTFANADEFLRAIGPALETIGAAFGVRTLMLEGGGGSTAGCCARG